MKVKIVIRDVLSETNWHAIEANLMIHELLHAMLYSTAFPIDIASC